MQNRSSRRIRAAQFGVRPGHLAGVAHPVDALQLEHHAADRRQAESLRQGHGLRRLYWDTRGDNKRALPLPQEPDGELFAVAGLG